MNILLPALSTLVTTIVAGIILNYLKNINARIIYQIKDAVPIKIYEKRIGAYLVNLTNPSSKTIKDVTINIQAFRVKEDG